MEQNSELYIQIRDGKPFEHPIFADNFRDAFPDIDVNNLPETFAKFVRIPQPSIGMYEVYEGVSYEWDGPIVKDVHHVRPMTEEERSACISELEVVANQMHLDRIAFCNHMLAEEADEIAQTLWLDCLTAHENWVLASVNPITPRFPPFPLKDENGAWSAP